MNTSLTLETSYQFIVSSEAGLTNMIIKPHNHILKLRYEHHNKTKHYKTVCRFCRIHVDVLQSNDSFPDIEFVLFTPNHQLMTTSQYQGPLLLTWINFNPINFWISNYIHYKMWDGITYPFHTLLDM